MNIVSTHAHYVYPDFYHDISMTKLIGVSYPGWLTGYPGTVDAFESMFDTLAGNGCFYWLCRALGDLYNDGEIMTRDNWRAIEKRMQETYAADPDFHNRIIREKMGLKWVILDEHRDPGCDHNLSWMRPSVRLDAWLLGQARTTEETLDAYLDNMEALVKRRGRAVALKLAVAYARGLDFAPPDMEKAREDFAAGQFSKTVQDTVAHRICDIAEAYDLPLQFHTGHGCWENTRAIHLLDMVKRHPKTRFVLLHCSVPWIDDALALGYLPNVYVDLAFLPVLSMHMCARFVREAVEMLIPEKIMWGCDTWTAEEAYGVLMATREALRIGLDGMPQADIVERKILHDNAVKLYKL